MRNRNIEMTTEGSCTLDPTPSGGMVSGFGEGKMETSFSSPTHTMLNGRNGYTMEGVFNGLGVATGSQGTTISEFGKELIKQSIENKVLLRRTIAEIRNDGTFKFAEDITVAELNLFSRMIRELGEK